MKLFNMNLRPFMDELDGGGGGGEPAPSTTDPVSNEPAGEPNSGVADPEQGADVASQKEVQTAEKNHAFAEMRRRADASEKRANDSENQRKRDNEVARKYGKDYNVYNDADVAEKYGKSHGVNTVAEFEAALQKEAQDQEYKDKGIDPDAVKEIIKNSPEMQSLRAQQGQAAITSEISELSAEYPDLNVKTLKDMQGLPNFDAIKEKAYRGMSLLEAYEAVNRAEIRSNAKKEGASETIRNIGSKAHLGSEKSGNTQQGKEVEISPEKMRVYKQFGFSTARAHQIESKYLKK